MEILDMNDCANTESSNRNESNDLPIQVIEHEIRVFSDDDEDLSNDESENINVIDTPGGTRWWIPDINNDLISKPVDDNLYDTLDEAYKMYQTYAAKCGFSVRKGPHKYSKEKRITHKYYLCNKAGVANNSKSVNTLTEGSPVKDKRNTNYKVTDCPARIKLKAVCGTNLYRLYDFCEKHNHPMDEPENKDLSRVNRKLNFEDQKYIFDVSLSNCGASMAHRLRACLQGGYENVRGTVVDYKNWRRDINKFIGNRDAQMLVDKLKNRKKYHTDFSLYYVCENRELTCLFWADETSKCNYNVFGDVVSFDATFRTNKYNMVFVPFTGIDNHNKCVTFGAALLKNENIVSYTWLLDVFLKSHDKRQPILVLTDQDPAMKQAIDAVFTDSQHRLCMWHIMKKLPKKVCGDLLKNTDFRQRLHKIVWNVFIEPSVFEERWKDLIHEFNLQENTWLSDMYSLRRFWIPAFFKHLSLSCLMKTTSRSESSNAFFRMYAHKGNTLVQFMLYFESAMDKQRYQQRILDHHTTNTKPKLCTPLKVEVHASNVYTRTLFYKVQKEILKGIWSCSQKNMITDNGAEVFIINHLNKKSKLVGSFKVVLNSEDGSIDCSCNHFQRLGYLCRHVFCVFKTKNIDSLPEKYILSRWRRDILPRDLLDIRHRYGNIDDENKKLANAVIDDVQFCINRLKNNKEKMATFVESIKQMKTDIIKAVPNENEPQTKDAIIADLLGVTVPDEILIEPPADIRNKGCGTGGKRLVGPREMADEATAKKSKQPKQRVCQTCFTITEPPHNSRTCPLKK